MLLNVVLWFFVNYSYQARFVYRVVKRTTLIRNSVVIGRATFWWEFSCEGTYPHNSCLPVYKGPETYLEIQKR